MACTARSGEPESEVGVGSRSWELGLAVGVGNCGAECRVLLCLAIDVVVRAPACCVRSSCSRPFCALYLVAGLFYCDFGGMPSDSEKQHTVVAAFPQFNKSQSALFSRKATLEFFRLLQNWRKPARFDVGKGKKGGSGRREGDGCGASGRYATLPSFLRQTPFSSSLRTSPLGFSQRLT